jgi:hypothetical protein
VQLFEPLPSQLAYPDILTVTASSHGAVAAVGAANSALDKEDSSKAVAGEDSGSGAAGDALNAAATNTSASAERSSFDSMNNPGHHPQSSSSRIDDVSRTWYPPLRNTLALLSKLYGVVEMVNIFSFLSFPFSHFSFPLFVCYAYLLFLQSFDSHTHSGGVRRLCAQRSPALCAIPSISG